MPVYFLKVLVKCGISLKPQAIAISAIVDDFCKAAVTGKLSPTNIWAVSRYSMPGLIAHESALKGGVLMDVPDLGDPPKKFELLDPYDFDYNQGK